MNLPQLPPPHLITTPDQLALMIADLRHAGRFALDTESNSLYAYYYRICLIQISTESRDYLIDPLALDDLGPLGELVSEPGIEVTMHAAENDLLLLDREFGFRFARVFDTLWAARILGWPRPGLASILKEQFGVELDKRMQRANWGKRPLTPEQLEYARFDTHFLLPLRERLVEELKMVGRLQEAREVFAELTNIRWEEKDPPTFWRLSGTRDLDPRQLAVLKALFDWREARAQRRDVPPFKVLQNETLLALAQTQPASEYELRKVRGMPKRLPDHLARKLLKVIEQAQDREPPAYPSRNNGGQRPDEADMVRYERLRAWRTRVARERGVEPDVVLTNQVLMAIARAHPADLEALADLGLLGPWKLQTYGPAILEMISRA